MIRIFLKNNRHLKAIPCFFLISIITISCNKLDSSPELVSKDEAINFVASIDSSKINQITTSTLPVTIAVNTRIPAKGLLYNVKVFDSGKTQVFNLDSVSNLMSLTLNVKGFQIHQKYILDITVTSNSNSSNALSKKYQIERNRVYKNYLKTSYELSNYDDWLSSDYYYFKGQKYPNFNPLVDQQHCQIDIDGDGLEDIFYFESYWPLNYPIPYKPPSVYMNNGKILDKIDWTGPKISEPHASKVLIGDFNNDSLPDIFSSVGYDVLPTQYGINQVSHLLLNSQEGFKIVKEFPEQPGFHHTASSGDIDNDGDLDIVLFNFAFYNNGISSKILWNNGKAEFKITPAGFSEIAPVVHSELYDVNKDGFLDLVMIQLNSHVKSNRELIVMWGDGKDFKLNNSIAIELEMIKNSMDIDFVDIDFDGISEIIITGDLTVDSKNPPIDYNKNYYIDIFKSDDRGKTFSKKTNQYFDVKYFQRFGHMIVRDLDKNGRIDIYAGDKKDNIRWEWNGVVFVKK